MPLRSKRSRAAKNTRQNACAAFAVPAPHTSSPDGLEYVVSDNGSDGPVMDIESGNESDKRGRTGVRASVEALQRLYSTVLPSHLRLEEDGHKKPWKMDNRKAVYTGDSQTTRW